MKSLIKNFLVATLVLLNSFWSFSQELKPKFITYIQPSEQIQSLNGSSSLESLTLRKSVEYTKVIKPVSLNKVLGNNSVLLNLPSKSILARTKQDLVSNGSRVWTGDWFDGFLMVTENKNGTSAYIRDSESIYEIQPLSKDASVLIKYNLNNLNKTCDSNEVANLEIIESDEIDFAEQSISALSPNALVRVLVLYTPAAASSGYNITSSVNTAFSQFLNASVNSGVVTSLQLAGIQSINFTESSDIIADLASISSNTTAQQLRNSYEADLVMMITDGNYFNYSGRVAALGPNEALAYGIVEVDYVTSNYTFIHELGHLFGARHEYPSPDNTANDTHGHEWKTGVWPFKKTWGTVMRTYENNLNQVLHFSNPGISYNGHATGVSGISFVSKHININGHIIEDFRYTAPPLSAYISGPGSANGGDFLFFQSNVSNGQSPYSYVWKANTGSGYYTIGTSANVGITMPSNSDLNLSLTVSDALQDNVTAYYFVLNLYENGGGCNPCPIISGENLVDFGSTSSVRLYPVPARNSLTYELKNMKGTFVVVKIINRFGMEVESYKISDASNNIRGNIDVSKYDQGIYYFITESENSISIEKFVKVH